MSARYFARDGEVFRMVDGVYQDAQPCYLPFETAEKLLRLFEIEHAADPHFVTLANQLRQAIADAKAQRTDIAA